MRSFDDQPATRQPVPLLVGLMGPSGGGKTKSALRLAEGMVRVSGGEIFHIDTEARRSLHYADKHTFRHVPFVAPFGPLDYLEAVEYCAKKGARVIIVDSASHEHEGRGGVLELHDAEAQRLAAAWGTTVDVAKMSAWTKPKSERRRFIDGVLQVPNCNFIFCFRAKPKLRIEKGKQPEPRGYMPIAGEEFVFEMMVNCLLLPNSGGVPIWDSREEGERMMIKLPEQFRDLFLKHKGPLDEDIGEAMARWAAGVPSLFEQLRVSISKAASLEELDVLMPQLKEIPDKKLIPAPEFRELKQRFAERKKILKADAEAGETTNNETGEVTKAEEERQPGEEG